MKKRTVPFIAAMLLASRFACADWKIQYDAEANRVMWLGGNTLRGSWCTRAEAEAYWNSQGSFERSHSKIVGFDCQGGSGGASAGTPEQQAVQGILGGLLKFIFEDPGTSRQEEIERQNALERRREEEQIKQEAMQAANQAWVDLQDREKEQKKIDEAEKIAAGEGLLTKMETLGDGELKLKTLGTDFFQGSAVDPNAKPGPLRFLTTREEQARRDAWYEERLQEQGYDDLALMADNTIKEDSAPASELEDSKEYKIVAAFFDRIGKVPGGQLPAYIGKVMLSAENEVFSSINAATDAIVNGTPPPKEIASGNVVQNIYYKTAESMVIDKAVELGNGVASRSGVGFMKTIYGEAGKAAELLLELGEDTLTIVDVWWSPKY